MHTDLHESGFLRIKQIIGDRKNKIPAIIPVSRSTWWEGVRTGRFPKPLKLSEKVTVWKVEDIRDLLDTLREERKERSGE